MTKSDIRTPHVSEAKKKAVLEISELIESYPIIAILDLENLPARQLQKMKTKLRKDALIRVAKKSVISAAIKNSKKKDIIKLDSHMTGTTALLLSKENPFKLFKILKQNKSQAPIKAGQIAPRDIILPAGPTPFAPGPIIGELGMLKIKAGIEGGKVAIKQDAHVASKGDAVSDKLASLLLRLGIEPMEIGLNLLAVYENGEILTADVLDIDQDVFLAKLQGAARDALGLSMEIGYTTRENIEMLIIKAYRDSTGLAVEQNILADEVADKLAAKSASKND